jgi:hypothetical protein
MQNEKQTVSLRGISPVLRGSFSTTKGSKIYTKDTRNENPPPLPPECFCLALGR